MSIKKTVSQVLCAFLCAQYAGGNIIAVNAQEDIDPHLSSQMTETDSEETDHSESLINTAAAETDAAENEDDISGDADHADSAPVQNETQAEAAEDYILISEEGGTYQEAGTYLLPEHLKGKVNLMVYMPGSKGITLLVDHTKMEPGARIIVAGGPFVMKNAGTQMGVIEAAEENIEGNPLWVSVGDDNNGHPRYDATIQNIVFDGRGYHETGNSLGTKYYAFLVTRQSRAEFNSVVFQNFGSMLDAVYVNGTGGNTLGRYAGIANFDNCSFRNCDTGIRMLGEAHFYSSHFDQTRIANANDLVTMDNCTLSQTILSCGDSGNYGTPSITCRSCIFNDSSSLSNSGYMTLDTCSAESCKSIYNSGKLLVSETDIKGGETGIRTYGQSETYLISGSISESYTDQASFKQGGGLLMNGGEVYLANDFTIRNNYIGTHPSNIRLKADDAAVTVLNKGDIWTFKTDNTADADFTGTVSFAPDTEIAAGEYREAIKTALPDAPGNVGSDDERYDIYFAKEDDETKGLIKGHTYLVRKPLTVAGDPDRSIHIDDTLQPEAILTDENYELVDLQ